MKPVLFVSLMLVAGVVAAQNGSVALVTTLGSDTLALEQFRYTPSGMEARVVLRTPQTTIQQYRLDLDDAGAVQRYEATIMRPGDATTSSPLRHELMTRAGDSLVYVITGAGAARTSLPIGDGMGLPFVDMVHWPFDLMLRRAFAGGRDSVTQQLFTARGYQLFAVQRKGEGRMTVTHPFRGTMEVMVDARGQLVGLDAGGTTRKLKVTRVPEVDLDAVAARFASMDAAGNSFGPLSGRGDHTATLGDATIKLDYGRPERRGRVVFGALVPWGQLWRTGANMATHLETDKPILIGTLSVPAGRYTLYTIPEDDGGVLIVNRQTGQGGTTYDDAQDLGRVSMTHVRLEEPVESFTIRIDPGDNGGRLRLMWDTSSFEVPVRNQ